MTSSGFFRFLHLLGLCAFVFLPASQSVPLTLENLKKTGVPKGGTIGIFSATFDPLTIHHTRLIYTALESGNFDAIVVIPADPNLLKAGATEISIRYEFVQEGFASDPRVLVPEYNSPEFAPTFLDKLRNPLPGHQTRAVVHWVQNKGYKTMGVILKSDVDSLGKGEVARIALANRLPVNSWLVSVPNKDKTDFSVTLLMRNRKYMEAPDPPSSSIVRKYLKAHPELYALGGNAMEMVPESELPVSLAVRKVIRQHAVYYTPSKDTIPQLNVVNQMSVQ
uniref:Cytidyltransferase-like domain-containing protein n=1 Tax=Chromera velia CCMP2878 TaxID=1169474 RepID=A0A0G4G8H1_9ALVE|eukprot:Cvel_4299.t1-p1 / transcript=Cvel_4299.t1 / gene=Cvel_4299 / organism=Chromera_velia_CCMP2878 / gene_product=hypothetical protein / transcript_product=hypothetical protein / location=Cvel_scaffold186:94011-94844(+) / protein_length=278 / sequence_SO=supercontig / SO=protein_coding / is_pseudo=false